MGSYPKPFFPDGFSVILPLQVPGKSCLDSTDTKAIEHTKGLVDERNQESLS